MPATMVTFTVPAPLLYSFDQVMQKQSKTRSEFLRETMRQAIQADQEWEQVYAFGRKQAKKMGIKTEDDVQRIIDEVREGK
jgi:metal-responsive CopG/Arc/MetJ family transcriptional regulator